MTKVLHTRTADLISKELESIPEKYAKSNFASTHEAIAVIREEFMELEKEVFWGEKEAHGEIHWSATLADQKYKEKMKKEALQLIAVSVRFIQECC